MVRTRMLLQLQSDQQGLFRVQSQVASGRRILRPSEDAPAALRAMGLQRLIERKTQVAVNLETNKSFLAATDATLNNVSNLLANVRGSTLGVVDTTLSEAQRQAVVNEVERAIDQLVDTGNQQFRGRYLFAGSRTTVLPFSREGKYINYSGNEGQLQSYSDIDMLFESSVSGNQVFGTISEPVIGTADLNPVVTRDTLLADLRGGQGIRVGSIAISDGLSTRVVDISPAKTVGDLAKLLEAHAPASRTLSVTVKPTGIDVSIDGGNLLITEVAGGTTASELGILRERGPAQTTVVGKDLNPTLRLTTRLDDLLGARAHAHIASGGAHNDIYLEANRNGDDLNGVKVQFVDDKLLQAADGLAAGNERAVYHETAQPARASLRLLGSDNDLILTAKEPGSQWNNVNIVMVDAGDVKNNPTATYSEVGGVRTLTLGIDDSGETTLADLMAAIEADTPFTAQPDPSRGEGFDPASAIEVGNVGATLGNTGNSGGEEKTLYVHISAGFSNANQVIAAINAEGTFSAWIDSRDTVLKSHVGLGVVSTSATTTTTGGAGINFDKSSGITITSGDATHQVSFETASTIEDLLNIINGSAAGVLAELNGEGTGINVRSRLSGANFSIGENGGDTATQLGIRSFSGAIRLDEMNFGRGVQTIEGTDFTIVSSDGTRLEIDLTGALTIDDVLNIINHHPDNVGPARVTAQLASYGNGIELVHDNPSAVDPQPLTVERAMLSSAAVDLGLVPVDAKVSLPPVPATAPTAELQLTNPNSDLTLTANQLGTALGEVQVVLVNNAAVGDEALVSYDPANKVLTIDVDPTATRAATVAAALNDEGTFTATLSTERGPNTGEGVIVDTGTVATTMAGSPQTLTGLNTHPQETRGVFNSLLRLRDALLNNDTVEISRALDLLDEDIERVNFARAEIGARQQALDVLQQRLDTEEIELKGALSFEIEVDFTEAISEMTARQYSFEAALRTTSSILQQTLLDYL